MTFDGNRNTVVSKKKTRGLISIDHVWIRGKFQLAFLKLEWVIFNTSRIDGIKKSQFSAVLEFGVFS